MMLDNIFFDEMDSLERFTIIECVSSSGVENLPLSLKGKEEMASTPLSLTAYRVQSIIILQLLKFSNCPTLRLRSG